MANINLRNDRSFFPAEIIGVQLGTRIYGNALRKWKRFVTSCTTSYDWLCWRHQLARTLIKCTGILNYPIMLILSLSKQWIASALPDKNKALVRRPKFDRIWISSIIYERRMYYVCPMIQLEGLKMDNTLPISCRQESSKKTLFWREHEKTRAVFNKLTVTSVLHFAAYTQTICPNCFSPRDITSNSRGLYQI